MIHKIFPVGPLGCNCSIFGDEESKTAFVIDPGGDLETITSTLAEHGLKVSAIIITHAHIDHVSAAQQLRSSTNAPIYMNGRDQELLEHLDVQSQWIGVQTPPTPEIDSHTSDGQTLTLGKTAFEVMHTPGHTQGSLCLLVADEKKLIAGDTLFRGSIGRTDLPGGDGRQLLASIKTKLMALPEETVVIPGHGPSTTIGDEKATNPFLRGL